jgi:hypothetical protein
MYIETVPNRGSPPAILLRESYRDGKSIRKRTLLNLSHWPAVHVEGLRGVLKGGVVIPAGQEALSVERSLPHGHVAAVLGTARAIGLERLLGPRNGGEPNRPRDLVMAMIVSRIIAPASKLATAKALDPATAASSLGVELGLGEVDESERYAALDWLRIPTNPATYSNTKPATCSDLKPAGIPISSRPPSALFRGSRR